MTDQSTQNSYFTINHFEDDGWTVLELPNGLTTFIIPRDWLPHDASIGDVLRLVRDTGEKESTVRFIVDEEAREVRLRHLEALKARTQREAEENTPSSGEDNHEPPRS